MKHYKAIIVSDVHLGTEDCKAVEFLKFLEEHHTDILIKKIPIVNILKVNVMNNKPGSVLILLNGYGLLSLPK